MPVIPSDFRRAMAHFATGVTVVTTVWSQKLYGMTVNAFCSVSLQPALVVVSLSLQSQTYDAIRRSRVYAVNILSDDQRALASRFACPGTDLTKTFTDLSFHAGAGDVPLFDDALTSVECRVAAEYPGGDHMLVLGEVVGVRIQPEPADVRAPLLYFRSTYGAPQHPREEGMLHFSRSKEVIVHERVRTRRQSDKGVTLDV